MKPDYPNLNTDPIRSAVDTAEDFRDPLDELVELTAVDRGLPFKPEMLKLLDDPTRRSCAF